MAHRPARPLARPDARPTARATAAVAALATALTALVLSPALVPAGGAALPRAGQQLDVLVIGDSYSAGNGATGTTYGPADCYRNTTHWGERYAAGLRDRGHSVTLTNHACSGGRTPDVHTPRPMDTQSGRTEPAPAGVTTTAQADDHLRSADPCNTRAFPAEEFWTYRATSVLAGTITYDCTRNLRPQADFVTPETDLVVFTMGGNDAGFSTIVQGCFVVATRTAAACREAVDAARGLVPAIKQRLVKDVAGTAGARPARGREDRPGRLPVPPGRQRLRAARPGRTPHALSRGRRGAPPDHGRHGRARDRSRHRQRRPPGPDDASSAG